MIELKKSNIDECDFVKLKLFTDISKEYGYQYGLFLYFPNNKPALTWFQNGNEKTGS